MANYSFTFKEDSLSHHGIEGQKWGVRNGPPYPLDSGDHSAAEKRAMNKDSKKIYKEIKRNKGFSITENIHDKLQNLKNNNPEIKEYNKAFHEAANFPKTKDAQKYLEDCAKLEYETFKNSKDSFYTDPNGLKALIYVYKNEGDVYTDAFSRPPKALKNKYSDVINDYNSIWEKYDQSLEKVKPILSNFANDVLGKYADKDINSNYWKGPESASEFLERALEFYFLDIE